MKIWTTETRVWVRNLLHDPRVAFSVQTFRAALPGGHDAGRRNVATADDAATVEQARAITRRYLAPEEVDGYVARWSDLRTIVTIIPDSFAADSAVLPLRAQVASPRPPAGNRDRLRGFRRGQNQNSFAQPGVQVGSVMTGIPSDTGPSDLRPRVGCRVVDLYPPGYPPAGLSLLGELDRWRRAATQAGQHPAIGVCAPGAGDGGQGPADRGSIVLTETIRVEKPGNERSERAAAAEAERARTRLLAEADDLKAARSKSTLGALLDRWMAQHEIEPTTRDTYESLIRNHIRPALGDVALPLLMRTAAQRLEGFYAELRRCRGRCNRRAQDPWRA